jgi:hypothetical protein
MSSSKRHFTAVVGSKEHGLYNSSSPSSAARKIVSKLCASSKSKKVEFCVREITQGSKKKTYGPYLGEMKKLAKPIELKGRIIRFDIKVHLKKKKTATKTAKKIGKKMRGGTITNGGELDKDDFIIDVNISTDEIDSEHVNYGKHYNLGWKNTSRPLIRYNIINFNDIEPCKFTRKNDKFQEPFIFFGKKIYGYLHVINKIDYYVHSEPIVYYEYVAFNEGIVRKTAKFNKLYISKKFSYQSSASYELDYDLQDVQISKIPKEELEELKKFIEKKRNRNNNSFEKNTFCKTIYNAVSEELSLRKSNTDTMFFREINRIEGNEKKIRLIQQNKQGEYRQLLFSINAIKQKLNAPANHHGHDGWTQGHNQYAYHKQQFSQELKELLEKKKEIESKYGIVNN